MTKEMEELQGQILGLTWVCRCLQFALYTGTSSEDLTKQDVFRKSLQQLRDEFANLYGDDLPPRIEAMLSVMQEALDIKVERKAIAP